MRGIRAPGANGASAMGSPTPTLRGALFGLGMAALAGCGMTDDPGSLLIDPGRYSAYHCDDLAARWKGLVAREKDLRALMDKADQTAGGAVIGSLAYRTDYEFGDRRRAAVATDGCGEKLQLHDPISERPDHSLSAAHAGVPASAPIPQAQSRCLRLRRRETPGRPRSPRSPCRPRTRRHRPP